MIATAHCYRESQTRMVCKEFVVWWSVGAAWGSGGVAQRGEVVGLPGEWVKWRGEGVKLAQ